MRIRRFVGRDRISFVGEGGDIDVFDGARRARVRQQARVRGDLDERADPLIFHGLARRDDRDRPGSEAGGARRDVVEQKAGIEVTEDDLRSGGGARNFYSGGGAGSATE